MKGYCNSLLLPYFCERIKLNSMEATWSNPKCFDFWDKVVALTIGKLQTRHFQAVQQTTNMIKNSKALFEIVKFLNALDLAMSIISKK